MTTAVAERKRKTHLEDLEDDHLDCRDLRHSWRRSSMHDVQVIRNKANKVIEFTRVLVCSRCGCERSQTYAVPSMDILRSRYAYPPGYQLLGSHSDPMYRVGSGDIRREVFKRVYARVVQ